MHKRKRSDACCDSHRFVEVVRTAYDKLPKHGKPTADEATVLAAIVLKSEDDAVSLVSLATGTKCIAHGNRQEDGTIVHDLHAEVLARRSAMHWVYQRFTECLAGEGQVAGPFEYDSTAGKFALRQGFTFHMVVSHPPCGDASIIHNGATTGPDTILLGAATNLPADEHGLVPRYQSHNAQRTGAKQVPSPSVVQSVGAPTVTHVGPVVAPYFHVPREREVEPGQQKHSVLRRKPGKGPATLSMSCSDKIAKWQLLGWQGALLSRLLKGSLRLASITCGSKSDISSQTPVTQSGVEHGSAVRRPTGDDVGTQGSTCPIAASSAAPDCSHGSQQMCDSIVSSRSSTEDSLSMKDIAAVKAQKAAMVRAFYARCKGSWEAVMCMLTEHEGSMATGVVMQQEQRDTGKKGARGLLEGWERSSLAV